jgi:flagellar hook-length control protein FliK
MVALDLMNEKAVVPQGMVAIKKETTSSSSIISFADLLQNLGSEEEVLNETLSPQIASEEEELLANFLQADSVDTKATSEDSLLLTLNKKATKKLSLSELKLAIKDAKGYLKQQIYSSDAFKRHELKDVPKTLKGLLQVAQKYEIELPKIELQELKNPTIKRANEQTKGQKSSIEENKTPLLLKKQPLQATISTQEMVHAKTTKIATSPLVQTEQRREATLKDLLKGKKALQEEKTTFLTSDFSVETAKVIAPKEHKKELFVSLESLLKSDRNSEALEDKEGEAQDLKTSSVHTHKADDLEVKINEAKQMMKYLSKDVKQAIDNYKSPFTRVKVQLNPQQLGEIDLTVVQRGKNLHVNLSSNNAAINTLAMNAHELKVQLQNSGINNASLNFSNNSQAGEQAASQQQQQHNNKRDAQSEYNYFEQEEAKEEIISSLEIIVPYYA